jgi:hypothetical protein
VRDVRFLLWTRDNPAHAQTLPFADPAAMNNSHFRADRAGGTVFIFHGFADTGDTGWIKRVTGELILKGKILT